MENIKNRNCIHPNSPHNNGEHEGANENDGAVEDDDNHDREQTVGWQKRAQTLQRCLCELFECSGVKDDWQRLPQKLNKFQRFEPAKFEVFELEKAKKNLGNRRKAAAASPKNIWNFSILSKKRRKTSEIDARRLQHHTHKTWNLGTFSICEKKDRKHWKLPRGGGAIAHNSGSLSIITLRCPNRPCTLSQWAGRGFAWEDGLQPQHTRSNGIT